MRQRIIAFITNCLYLYCVARGDYVIVFYFYFLLVLLAELVLLILQSPNPIPYGTQSTL